MLDASLLDQDLPAIYLFWLLHLSLVTAVGPSFRRLHDKRDKSVCPCTK